MSGLRRPPAVPACSIKQPVLSARIKQRQAYAVEKENLSMRITALAILTVTTALTTAPARAQTYDPAYPVCLQTYGIDGNFIDCSYNALAQCAQSAAGRAAQCITNPFFAGGRAPAGPNTRRPRGTS